MKLLFFCPLWGSEDIPFSVFCQKVHDAGYDGVELSFPLNDIKLRDTRLETLNKYNLPHIAQHWETIEPNPTLHSKEYRTRLQFLTSTKPLFINSQSGRDWFSFEENMAILDNADELSAQTGIRIFHETHRGKFAFSAQATMPFIAARPELRLTADFSHWCSVSESLLEDQTASVTMAISRSNHVHARVGYQEGPQVSDFRAPEWQPALTAHLQWWDAIVALHQKLGSPQLTICPEFGPWPYMTHLPGTQSPIANQWEINHEMMTMLRKRWSQII